MIGGTKRVLGILQGLHCPKLSFSVEAVEENASTRGGRIKRQAAGMRCWLFLDWNREGAPYTPVR